ncbi:sulfotransferase family 2 domain-containing protein [Myxosarcina sp. GI1(2024)]
MNGKIFSLGNTDNRASATEVIIFQHIPKTAGTTLRYIIQYQFPPSAICELYGSSGSHLERVNKLKNLSEFDREKLEIINTHLGFGIHQFLSQPYTYITFLREPVERVISMYYYYQKTKNPLFQHLSLSEFVSTYGAVQNGMTKNLSGVTLKRQLLPSEDKDSVPFSEANLEIAKQNLRTNFKFIGICEQFDESSILLQRILGWKIPLYDKSNVSKRAKNIARETLNLIEKSNQLDIQLYEYARAIFQEQIARQDSSFKHEVELFKTANQSTMNKLYFKVKTGYNRGLHRIYKELASFS